jgi:hypothetical protein
VQQQYNVSHEGSTLQGNPLATVQHYDENHEQLFNIMMKTLATVQQYYMVNHKQLCNIMMKTMSNCSTLQCDENHEQLNNITKKTMSN